MGALKVSVVVGAYRNFPPRGLKSVRPRLLSTQELDRAGFSQPRIDRYFMTYHDNKRVAAIKSKRLRTAVEDLAQGPTGVSLWLPFDDVHSRLLRFSKIDSNVVSSAFAPMFVVVVEVTVGLLCRCVSVCFRA